VNEFQQRIGVGETHYGLARTGPTRKRKVIAEEGSRKGKVAAIQTDHGDGRVDAQVFVDTVKKTLSFSGKET
jgi:hypothetical protein